MQALMKFYFLPFIKCTENDSYVSWNWISNTWSIGSLGRTAGIDTGTFNLPLYMTSEFIFKLSGTSQALFLSMIH